MADALGIGLKSPPGLTSVTPVSVSPTAELLSAPIAVQGVATIAAIVLERSPDGALLLRSTYGMLSLKTQQNLPPGTRVELRVLPGNPPTVAILSVTEPEAAEAAPSTRIDIGTTLGATVVTPGADAAAPDAGARVLLRVGAATTGPAVSQGTIALGSAGETLVETPLAVYALDRRLALPPGTTIEVERLPDPSVPAEAEAATATSSPTAPAPRPGAAPPPPPSQTNDWPSLDQALAALDKAAPALAHQLRAELSPQSPAALAGTLLFLAGALQRGAWPREAIGRALSGAGLERLRARLDGETAELGNLSKDSATGEWQALTLPLLTGEATQLVRLFVRRGAGQDANGDAARFVIEAELSQIGPMQLDGLVRGHRLDVVLRSHGALPAELRAETTAIFHQASAAQGFQGDIVFATTPQFTVAPLAGMRRHVELRI